MKYEINLLPPTALASRVEKIQTHRETAIFLACLMACALVLSGYGAIWWALHSLQVSLADQIVSQNKNRDTIVARNKDVNGEIVPIDARVTAYTLWTPRISDVVLAAPKGILISRLELIEDPETVVVTGTASQGSEAVAYQSNLEKLPWVDHVVAPLQNFARAPEATITFTIFQKGSSSSPSVPPPPPSPSL